MNDNALINSIRQRQYKQPMSSLYQYYPVVEKFVLSNSGSRAEAKDLFQEALVVCCRKVSDPSFELTSSLNTYLFGICKYLWKDELRKKNKSIQSDENEWEDLEDEASDWVEQEQKFKLAESAIAQLGQRCKDVLEAFYIKAWSMVQIAKKMSFSSAKIAKNQKYKCLEKAREFYRQSHQSNH